MKKYHYIDGQGNISDALPLAALQKIELPPATKVLIEGGKQWITLAEATAGGPAVAPPPPPPPRVAVPSIPAKSRSPLQFLEESFKRAVTDSKQAQDKMAESFDRAMADSSHPEGHPTSQKPANLAPSHNSLQADKGGSGNESKQGCKRAFGGCLVTVVVIFIAICGLLYWAARQDSKNASLPEWQRGDDPNKGKIQIAGDTARLHCTISSTYFSSVRNECAMAIWKAAKSNTGINRLIVTVELTQTLKDDSGNELPKPLILGEITCDSKELEQLRNIGSMDSTIGKIMADTFGERLHALKYGRYIP